VRDTPHQIILLGDAGTCEQLAQSHQVKCNSLEVKRRTCKITRPTITSARHTH